MLRLCPQTIRLCAGISRREAVRVGGLSALGLSLPQLLTARTAQAAGEFVPTSGSGISQSRARSVILFWLTGGPPQHETWDPKPEAPDTVRGPFAPIATDTPGLHISELMPRTSRLTRHLAVLRGVVSHDNAHSSSGYQMLTGVPHVPLSRENVTAQAPNLSPSLGAITRVLRPDRGGLPSAITLPRHIANVGEIVWPGQDAGFLGRRYDPWLLTCDPSAEDFRIPDLALPVDVPAQRVDRRHELLTQIDGVSRHLDRQDSVRSFSQHFGQAFDLLRGRGARQAFDLTQEPDAVRDRYGRTRFAQSVLLARRLVEAGVSLVQVNWQRLDGRENNGSWDIHKSFVPCCRDFLCPIMDQSFSALLEDLDDRGLLDETLVAWVGEFGHTPRINARAGRDHWGSCFSVALAGGGIRGGTVFGASDREAAHPVSGRVEPRDIAATIFHCMGFSPETQITDQQGRPLPISRGHVIEPILQAM